MIKRLVLFCTVATSAVLAGCGMHVSVSSNNNWSDADLQATTNVTETAEIPASLTQLDVDNSFGAVRITGTDTGQTHWIWKLAIRARNDAEAQQIADQIVCKTNLTDGRLSLAVSVPSINFPHSIQSDFEISVPKAVSVHTKDAFGRTDIAQLNGNVEAAGQNGAMEIHDIGGHVNAGTSFDSLLVSDTGAADLRNQNGEIQAIRVKDRLDAHTSFAGLLAQDIGGPATLSNQNGNIKAANIRGALGARTSFDSIEAHDIRGSASLTNQNGRIEATGIGGPLEAGTSFAQVMARDIAGKVLVHDQNGDVQVVHAEGDADIKTSFSRINVENISGDANLANQNGEIEATGVTGVVRANTSFASMQLKGSGPEFICHNQNGSIRLNATAITTTNIEAKTSFDNIELHLPSIAKPAVVAHTTFGDVDSDFPVLLKPSGQDAFADAGPGTIRAVLQNQNGNIRIRKD